MPRTIPRSKSKPAIKQPLSKLVHTSQPITVYVGNSLSDLYKVLCRSEVPSPVLLPNHEYMVYLTVLMLSSFGLSYRYVGDSLRDLCKVP